MSSKLPSIKSIRLVNYKGFENHLVSLRHSNVLIGANNAGKSTVLGALRLVVAMIPRARRVRPNTVGAVFGRPTRGWVLTGAAIDAAAFSTDNIRFDFRSQETRIEVTLRDKTLLIIAWADASDDQEGEPAPPGVFFIFPRDGFGTNLTAAARELVPDISVVPTLTPLEQREGVVGAETLAKNLTAKSSSRYFRNALYALEADAWTDFESFVCRHTPEVSSLSLARSHASQDDELDLFYAEGSARHEREIAWAGDGIQIWLQALYHIWRLRQAPIIVLDEPDVFLHPDLQRRLARVLFGADRQVVVATHSIEILAEAEPGSAVWVDRGRRNSERPKADGALSIVGRRLGSGFELGVGRALRSNVVLFVEGDDAPVIANLARQAGKHAIARSDAYATIPLGGFSQNWRVGAFSETMTSLGNAVKTFVILDNDLRSDAAIEFELAKIKEAGARAHIWQRRELENYVLDAGALSKASKISYSDADELLTEAVEAGRDEARRTLVAQRLSEKKSNVGGSGSLADLTVLERADSEFELTWSTATGKLALADAKLVLRSVNAKLQARQARTVNSHSLSRNILVEEMPEELRSVLAELEELILVGGGSSMLSR
ncbi:ATP-dependent endonuclease [Rathayibacter sp. AY1F9]|uniref:ATP-dependent nuclease n=1 Tax=Rathayibacter sp. AY1F9 TaxID=2080563 RepID=UPI000CE83078|nr:ATP-binding protein [Rathayibacter sp. AY1F9]PPH26932.1 hypothetical protein C5C37_15200 [Rathayibacter sp. AY1F9]